ncbi:MAG: DUF2254 family protein [Chloroflexota bacterium]
MSELKGRSQVPAVLPRKRKPRPWDALTSFAVAPETPLDRCYAGPRGLTDLVEAPLEKPEGRPLDLARVALLLPTVRGIAGYEHSPSAVRLSAIIAHTQEIAKEARIVMYHLLLRVYHELTVFWYWLSEALRRLSIALGIVRVRLALITITALLVAAAYLLDVAFGPALRATLGLSQWSADAARGVLLLVATSAAVVISILLSVSLLVLQSTAQRYGNRIVRYLIDEEVGNYILDSLVAALLVSTFGLFTASRVPVSLFTPLLSIILLTFGVISLVVYRSYVLAFLTPSRSADDLGRNISGAIAKVASGGHFTTPAIVDYLRRRCASWLEDLNELGRILAKERGDSEGVSAAIGALVGVLARYGRIKVRIPEHSAWFPSKTIELSEDRGWAYFDQKRLFSNLGLGHPTTTTRDSNWVEDLVLDAVRELTHDALSANLNDSVRTAVIALDALGRDTAETEEKAIMSGVLAQLESLSERVTEDNVRSWGANVANAWLAIGDAHMRQLQGLKPSESLATLIWQKPAEAARLRLPRLQHEVAMGMFAKLALESDYAGHIVTPTNEVMREISESVETTIGGWHRDVLTRTRALLRSCSQRSLQASWPQGSAAWVGNQLLMATRSFALGLNDLAEEMAAEALPTVPRAHQLVRDDARLPARLTDLVEDILRFQLKGGGHAFLQTHLPSAVTLFALEVERVRKEDQEPAVISAHIRLMVVAGYALLLAELDQQPETRMKVREAMEKTFSNPKATIDLWTSLTTSRMNLALGIGTQVIARYHDLWLHFRARIEALPKVWESETDEIGYSERAEHPSSLVQRISRYQMLDWDIKDLVAELAKDFHGDANGHAASED